MNVLFKQINIDSLFIRQNIIKRLGESFIFCIVYDVVTTGKLLIYNSKNNLCVGVYDF